MFDLLKLLIENSPSLTRDMQVWFEKYRADGAWNVYSDYCVGNTDKANDSFSFVITLKHDTDKNFSEYIAKVAPKDLKKTRQSSEGLISYLNCPVAFSVSFIVERESKLLRDFITDDNIHGFCSALRELIALCQLSLDQMKNTCFESTKPLESLHLMFSERNSMPNSLGRYC